MSSAEDGDEHDEDSNRKGPPISGLEKESISENEIRLLRDIMAKG